MTDKRISISSLQRMSTTELCRLAANSCNAHLGKEQLQLIYDKMLEVRAPYLLTSFLSKSSIHVKMFKFEIVNNSNFDDFVSFLSRTRRLLYFIVNSSEALRYAYDHHILTESQLISLFEHEAFYSESLRFAQKYNGSQFKFYKNDFLCSFYLSHAQKDSIKYFVRLLEISKIFDKFLKSNKWLTHYLNIFSQSQKRYVFLKTFLDENYVESLSNYKSEDNSKVFEEFFNCLVSETQLIRKIVGESQQVVSSKILNFLENFYTRKLISFEFYSTLKSSIS